MLLLRFQIQAWLHADRHCRTSKAGYIVDSLLASDPPLCQRGIDPGADMVQGHIILNPPPPLLYSDH